jgi:hypothetical protein
VREQAIQLAFHTASSLVQRAPGRRAQKDVQADREHALVAALQRGTQSLSVLQANIALGVRDALGQQIHPTRGFQFGDLYTERSHHLRRRQRSDVHAQLEWQVQFFHKRCQPAGRDRARVAGHDQHARVMRIKLQMVPAYVDAGRRDEVCQRASAKGEQALVRRQFAFLMLTVLSPIVRPAKSDPKREVDAAHRPGNRSRPSLDGDSALTTIVV